MSNSFWLYGLLPTSVLCPWDSLVKDTGVGCHALPQRIFPIQVSSPCLIISPELADGFFTTSASWEAPWASLVAQTVKNLPAMQKTWVWSLGWEDPLEKGVTTTPVFLPREFHGQRSLVSYIVWASLVAQMVKNWLAMWEPQVWSLGWEDPPEKEMASHSSILAWRIPWTEEFGGLQSKGPDMTEWLTLSPSHFMLVYPGPRKRTEGNKFKRGNSTVCRWYIYMYSLHGGLIQNTIVVLNFLGAQGYRVFQTNTQISNAQITKQQVNDLGYIIYPESRPLSPYRKQTIVGPKTKKHLCIYLLGQGRIF